MPGPGVTESWEPLAGFEAGTAGLPGTGSWSGCAVPHVVVPVRPPDTEDIMPMIHTIAISWKYLIEFLFRHVNQNCLFYVLLVEISIQIQGYRTLYALNISSP